MKEFPSKQFQTALLKWYRQNARLLPWRSRDPLKANPYHVWLSEIMLQQTIVATVIPYFQKFITRWPTVHHLARANDTEVMKEWAGLGYYARARNLIACAKQIVDEYDGVFPSEELELIKLKGIGAYTSAAIRAIAYNKNAIVVDGNIERIASRVFKVEEFLPEAKSVLKKHSANFFKNTKHNSEMAQGLMDLGATICIPKTPRCDLCPVSKFCELAFDKQAGLYPRKHPKAERPVRKGYALILHTKSGDIWCERRNDNRMLGGMLGLPTSHWDKKNNDCEYDRVGSKKIGEIIHVFSHFELHLEVRSKLVTKSDLKSYKNSGEFIQKNDILNIGFPSLFQKAIKVFLNANRD